MLKDTDVRDLAARIFSQTLGPLGFERVEVTSGVDQDGDRSFFLEAFFKPGTKITRVRPLVDARVELRDVMLDRGEERSPYVFYRILDGDEPLSDEVDDEESPKGRL